ncbi:MAG: serine/threonine-protein kinase [Planctomycetota bacterium]
MRETWCCPAPPASVTAAVEEALVAFLLRRDQDADLAATCFAASLPEVWRGEFLVQARQMLAASSRLAAANDLPVRIGGYRIERLLGQGGTARVFVAASPDDGRRVAVKVLHPHLAAHPHSRARLLREASIAASIRHPRLVAVHQCGDDGGRLFLVMDLVGGTPLHEVLRTRSTPWLADARAMARSFAAVAEALDVAHARGVVHRDLKPSNLMLGGDGALTVLDFGLSTSPVDHITCSSDFLGTPAYMSPEQASGDQARVGAPSDIYSLGTVLYECVTGRPAVVPGALPRVLDAVRSGRVPAAHRVADVPRALSRVLGRCLAKNPRRRYARAADLARDLRAFAAVGRPDAAGGPTWLRRTWRAAGLAMAGVCAAATPRRLLASGVGCGLGARAVTRSLARSNGLLDCRRQLT